MLDNLMRFSIAGSLDAMKHLVIPHMILEGKESRRQLLKILDSLESKASESSIACWDTSNPCAIYHQFLKLESQVDQLEETDVDIEHLLAVASDLEGQMSRYSCPPIQNPYKIRYGFTRAEESVVLTEMGKILSNLRMKLLASKNGQSFDHEESTPSSQLDFAITPGGLYSSAPTESILREFCGFKAMS